MIVLDIQNCFSENIGPKYGFTQKAFLSALRKNDKILKKLHPKNWGFLSLPYADKNFLSSLQKKAAFIQKNFKTVYIIGIGGSSLGAIALLKSLKPFRKNKPEVIFLDNPESEQIQYLLNQTKAKETLLIPISKSGNTIESLSLLAIFYEKLKKELGGKASKHVIAITEKNNNTLAKIAHEEQWETFPVPKDVGGRFSVFTAVGLLPVAILDIDIEKLLLGAQKAEPETAYILALMQYLFYKKKKEITTLFGYGKKFEGIIDWYLQLLAESIGKKEHIGPTPLKAIGPLDQHSLLQLFMDGPNNKFFIFLETEEEVNVPIPQLFQQYEPFSYLKNQTLQSLMQTEKRATMEALTKKNRANITLKLSQMNEEGIGELLFLFQLQIAILGESFQINTFDQPGVELGKKLTQKYLRSP